MIGVKTGDYLYSAVEAEKINALENHGDFHSHHEGWAILREEVQEVMECSMPFSGVTGSNLDRLWGLIRDDAMFEDEAKMLVEQIYEATEEMTKECIQVMAVCKKWMRLIEVEREE